MPPNLLVITSGPDAARATFRDEGRGLWSEAVALVLEKHGFVGLETATATQAESMALEEYDAIVAGRLTEDAWTRLLTERILALDIPVLLEAPLPAPLREAAGIARVKPTRQSYSLTVIDSELYELAAAYGAAPGGRVIPSISKPVDRDSRLDWQAVGGDYLDEAQAAAWREPGWDVERWLGLSDDVRVLAEWARSERSGTHPAIIARNNLIAVSCGLLSFVAQAHTSEPSDGAEWRSSPRTTGLEVVLLGLVDLLY